ncbi:uncharacterized protein [Medicago truncatula]|uniref:uncharacterized protein n=1 Tax=Medicago truncatula TaxID=3880 RepID=UPI000D2F153A|nr:uncharacterized protein LOC112417448 [Medicago truncatula]
MGAFNISLLGKWCWRLLTEKGGLWYRVLKSRYGEVGGRIREGGSDSSAWWRMMCRLREGIGEGVGNWFEDNIRRVVRDGRNTLFWYDRWIGDVPLRLKFPRLFNLAVEKECSVGEMVGRGLGSDGGAWVWRRRLFAWEEESVRECSLLFHNIVLQDSVCDTWQWLLDPVHGYTVRGVYRFLTTTSNMVDRSLVDDVWKKHVPLKVSLLVWRLLRNRIPTKDNLALRGVLSSTDMACALGCVCNETVNHLFLQCTLSTDLWAVICNWLGISFVLDGELRHHFQQFTKMAGMPIYSHLFFTIIWFVTIWVIWKEMNNRIFNGTVSNNFTLKEKVKLHSFLWLKSKQPNFVYS